MQAVTSGTGPLYDDALCTSTYLLTYLLAALSHATLRSIVLPVHQQLFTAAD